MKNRTARKSLIAPYIDGLLEEKYANGYSYESEELVLNRFDSYCINKKLKTPEITKAFRKRLISNRWLTPGPLLKK